MLQNQVKIIKYVYKNKVCFAILNFRDLVYIGNVGLLLYYYMFNYLIDWQYSYKLIISKLSC